MGDILSPYIAAGVIAWLVAQVGKYIILSVRGRTIRHLRQLYLSGSMPSAHSATVMAVLTVIAGRDGAGSAIFGLGAIFAAVVMYDALMVRRSSGEQGQSLTALIKEQKSAVVLPRVAKGHTPLEVAVGALIGVVIGIVVYFATT